MGIRLGLPSSPPIRVYREHVDGLFVALIVYADAFHRGGYYRASTFRLIPMDAWLQEVRYRPADYGEAALIKDCGEYLKYVCAAVNVQL